MLTRQHSGLTTSSPRSASGLGAQELVARRTHQTSLTSRPMLSFEQEWIISDPSAGEPTQLKYGNVVRGTC